MGNLRSFRRRITKFRYAIEWWKDNKPSKRWWWPFKDTKESIRRRTHAVERKARIRDRLARKAKLLLKLEGKN